MPEARTKSATDGKDDQDHAGIAGYGAPDWPMGSYAALIAVYNAIFAAFLAASKKSGRKLPEKISPADLLLLGIAAHRMSRLITKDYVTSPLRAMFTEYQGSAGPSETREKARGKGMRQAMGELLTCPWCAGQWTASFFVYGLVLSPRLTRLVASILVISDISEFLNLAETAADKRL